MDVEIHVCRGRKTCLAWYMFATWAFAGTLLALRWARDGDLK